MKIAKLLQYLTIICLAISFNACSNALPLALDFNTTDYERLVSKSVEKMAVKIKEIRKQNEVVLVTDFVNVDKLQNRSQLGFLLSSTLKDNLTSKYDLTFREVELSKNFGFGEQGLKLLTRKQKDIDSTIYMENYAIVGTYTITARQLIIFIKVIDIYTGHVIASSSNRTRVTNEVKVLDKGNQQKKQRKIYAPFVL